MSAEQTLYQEEVTRKTRRKRDRGNLPNKEGKNDKKQEKADYEQQSILQQQMKSLPKPIIYNTLDIRNQRDVPLTADENNIQDQQRQIATDAKEISDYYLKFHKSMINIYNSIYYQILQDISNSYNNNGFLTVNERFTDYSFEIENMYSNLISNNRDKSLKLIDNIIIENLDTFIKSIELAQKFYKNVINSYFNCIKK
jgi:hypothetical protein